MVDSSNAKNQAAPGRTGGCKAGVSERAVSVTKRFLLDVMLGRLARWLRALGHNAAYDHAADDPSLLRRAARERRLLVTRDTRLAATPRGPRTILLRANDTPGQLRELVEALGITRHPGLLSRCIVCNTRLRTATADQVEERVPEYVRSRERAFRACPGCGRVYWAGTHRRGIIAALESALPDLGVRPGGPGRRWGRTPRREQGTLNGKEPR